MTDKKLVSLARSRVSALRKNELTGTTAYQNLIANLKTFNYKHGYSDTNIRFNKRMSVQERKEMRSILSAFVRNPESTKSGIIKRLRKEERSLGVKRDYRTLRGTMISDLLKSYSVVESSKSNWRYEVFGGEITRDVMYNARSNGMDSGTIDAVLKDVIANINIDTVRPSELTADIIRLLGYMRRGEMDDYSAELSRLST